MTSKQKEIGMTEEEAANNLKVKIEGKILTLQIALDVVGTPSASGKSLVVGTTRGNKPLPEPFDNTILGLNCYRDARV